MLQYRLIKLSPKSLRWYRTRLNMDWSRFKTYLPEKGRLLDVGCGIGSLDYEIGYNNSELSILGIDVNQATVEMAQTYHNLPNVKFACVELQAIKGKFDCILFADVFHHIPFSEQSGLLSCCVDLLAPNGYLLLKDIERNRGQVSWFMDTYISGCDQVYMRNCDEMANLVSESLQVIHSEVHFRLPFPHYYIKARLLSS